jgi:hypothetical protein
MGKAMNVADGTVHMGGGVTFVVRHCTVRCGTKKSWVHFS